MKLRDLRFADVSDCLADIEQLRTGWRHGGSWSLAQVCWHLEAPLRLSLHPPATTEPTPRQLKFQAFLDQVVAAGWAEGARAPREMQPPVDAGPEAIDAYISALGRLRAYELPFVDALLFGPVATAKFRRFMLAHAGHHLGFFEPDRPAAP